MKMKTENRSKSPKKKLHAYAGYEASPDFHLEVLNIKVPEKTELEVLQKEFNLSATQIHDLEMLLKHVHADLEAFNTTYADTEGRMKKINAALEIEDALLNLRDVFERHQNELNECLPIDVQERIGEAFDLSFARFSVNDHVSYKRLNNDLEKYFCDQKTIKAEQIEHLTLPRRQAIGMKGGGHMLWFFIEHIHRPMAVWTALHNANSGGRPRKYTRTYLLHNLASEAKGLLGAVAPTTKKGRFVDFAMSVVELCGLEPQGTDAAIPEIVRKIRNGGDAHKGASKKKSKKV